MYFVLPGLEGGAVDVGVSGDFLIRYDLRGLCASPSGCDVAVFGPLIQYSARDGYVALQEPPIGEADDQLMLEVGRLLAVFLGIAR